MRSVVIGIALATACSCAQTPPPRMQPADTILIGDGIYTMRPWGRREAQAVAIRGAEIVYVGDAAGVDALRGPSTQVISVAGKMVLPGFHDAHVHLVTGGIEYGQCNLNNLETRESVFEKIRDYAAAHPDDVWIVGGGWSLPLFPGGSPTVQQLDELIADRPAYLTGADGHSAWVNSKALELAGIDADTADPPGGRIERAEDGAPSGTLRESAMELVSKRIPALEPDDYVAGLRRGMAMANRFGITSAYEANASPHVLAAYRALEARGELTVRVVAAQSIDPRLGPEQLDAIVERAGEIHSDRLRATSIKIFLDGVIEAKTAALLEPYEGSESSGTLLVEPEALAKLVTAADALGLDIHMHAIGDRAIRVGLDAIEAARDENGERDRRPTIAHLQLLEPADIPRFHELDVTANFQPLWAQADTYITELTVPILGRDRSRWLYPIATVIASRARVVAGSDWSVSSMNPLDAIEVGITRVGIGKNDRPLSPIQRADLDELLRAYTVDAAYLLRTDELAGTLEVGKRADIVVLDRNLFDIQPTEIHDVHVVMTMIDGKVVYRR